MRRTLRLWLPVCLVVASALGWVLLAESTPAPDLVLGHYRERRFLANCALSYAAPVLSTAFLVAAGDAAPTWHIGAGCVLVAGGAALAAYGERGVG